MSLEAPHLVAVVEVIVTFEEVVRESGTSEVGFVVLVVVEERVVVVVGVVELVVCEEKIVVGVGES